MDKKMGGMSKRPKARPKTLSVPRPRKRPDLFDDIMRLRGGDDLNEMVPSGSDTNILERELLRRLDETAVPMKMGGKVKAYKGGGCVMKGRGGSYKGMK